MPRFKKFEDPRLRRGWLASNYTTAAKDLFNEKSYSAMEHCLLEGHAKFPDDAHLANALGRHFINKRRHGQALNLFQQAVDKAPDNTRNRIDLADTLAKVGRLDDSVREFLIAIRSYIREGERIDLTINRLGHAYFINQRYQDATDAFGLSLNVNPQNDIAERRLWEMDTGYGLKPSPQGMQNLAKAIADGMDQTPKSKDAVKTPKNCDNGQSSPVQIQGLRPAEWH